jgi:uncharacterized protein YdbL (DUF1318 family)
VSLTDRKVHEIAWKINLEDGMRKNLLLASLTTLMMLAACVTINIYFPAEEVRSAADRIVQEVWSERNGAPAPQPVAPPAAPAAPAAPAEKQGPTSLLRQFWGASTVHAAQDINVTTPEIRAIKEAMKARTTELRPFLDGGQVGIGRDGLLKVRTLDGLDLRARSQVNRLVTVENQDRLRLYKEIANANKFPDRAHEVQAIFADSWREQAASGWYIEDAAGAWSRR